MAKNLIPEICKMLGVELFEEFKVMYKVGFEIICNFTKEGVFVHEEGRRGKHDKELLTDIICGKVEIVKLPWKPKERDIFYSFSTTYGKWVVRSNMWAGAPCDYALLDKGWVFRTKEEAEDALPAVATEMGVEYKLYKRKMQHVAKISYKSLEGDMMNRNIPIGDKWYNSDVMIQEFKYCVLKSASVAKKKVLRSG